MDQSTLDKSMEDYHFTWTVLAKEMGITKEELKARIMVDKEEGIRLYREGSEPA